MDVIGLTDIIIETGTEKYRIQQENRIDLPDWLALLLDEEGIVKIAVHDNKYYRRTILAEKKESAMSPIEEDFYEIAAVTLKKADPVHRKKLAVSLRELIDLRVQKLMQLALHDAKISVPHREKILYSRVHKEVKNWIIELEEILNGD